MTSSTHTQLDRFGVGRAHGKAILIGEHSVVYGAPAIAVPLYDLGVEATLDDAEPGFIDSELYVGPTESAPERLGPPLAALRLAAKSFDLNLDDLRLRLRSTIPFERGLGSSAAVSTAIIRAGANFVGAQLTKREVYDLVQEAERVAHGTPSGLDAYTVSATSAVRFQKAVATPLLVSKPFQLVVADTGVRGRTMQAVGLVRQQMDAAEEPTRAKIDALAELAEQAEHALREGDTGALGDAMNSAHATLSALGVSSPELDNLVAAARGADAAGAKMTGGGLGGCVLALAQDSVHAHKIVSALRKAGAKRAWTSSLASVTTQPVPVQSAPTQRR